MIQRDPQKRPNHAMEPAAQQRLRARRLIARSFGGVTALHPPLHPVYLMASTGEASVGDSNITSHNHSGGVIRHNVPPQAVSALEKPTASLPVNIAAPASSCGRRNNGHTRRLATALAILALCGAFVARSIHVPAAVPVSAPPTMFSAERAIGHVRAIAQRPHPTGSEDNARVRAYLLTELTALGLAPQVQEATGVGTCYPVSGRVRNVLVRMPGTHPGGLAVLLMAHYDGVPAAPAAADNASGSAVLLETLRALRAGPPLSHDVIALFTDGEEPGLIGSAAFVREHSWAKDVGVALNFEARGTHGRSLMFQTGSGNLDVLRVLRSVPDVSTTSLLTHPPDLPNDTDISELAIMERPALGFAFLAGADRYHTAEDDVAHLSPGSVQHHGDQAVALARVFGNGPLPRPPTPDAVFFDVPLLGLVVYPESWALPLALVAAALVLAALVRLRGSETRWVRDPALGALGSAAAILLAGTTGIGTALAVQRLHATLAGGGSPGSSGVYAGGIALLAFALAAACYATVRRWAGATGTHVGVLVVWAAASTLVASWEPGMSFLFTWPLLAAAAPALANRGGSSGPITHALVWVATFVTIAVLVPTLYIAVFIALGIDKLGGGILAGFVAFAAWLLAPQLESLGRERRWLTPALAGAAALALFAFGMATVRTDAKYPIPSSIVYAVDSDSGTAWLTGPEETGVSGSWLREALGPSARTLSPSRADAPAWLARTYGFGLAAPAPLAALGAPVATVLGDSLGSGERRVTLRVRTAPGTLAIEMSADSGAVLAATVDGRGVDTTRYRNQRARWSLMYVAPSDSGFTLELTLRPAARLTLELMARVAGIPTLPGVRIPPRPAGVIPAQWGDWTLVYRRVRL